MAWSDQVLSALTAYIGLPGGNTRLLFPAILVFTCIGVFSVNNLSFEVFLLALFGVVGIMFAKLDREPAPLLLAFVVGPLMEEYFRRSLQVSRGSLMIFVERPISAGLLLAALALIAIVAVPSLGRFREQAFKG